MSSGAVPVAAITIVAGRHRHLLAQRRHLRRLRPGVDVHVVVALGDAAIPGLLADAEHPDDPRTVVVSLPADPLALPLSAARNAGARAAIEAGAALLVFLDVDCLPGRELATRYATAARQRPHALLCGPVTYLPPRPDGWPPDELAAARRPHPARPDPPPGRFAAAEHALFWSLSFAVTAMTWSAIGGFDEGYTGYGAEDTDFGRRAREQGVPLVFVGGADAFHQYHPTSTPPVQHVDAILRNGARYERRWGEWPMTGWLEEFERLGLVHRADDGWRRAAPLRVATLPARHPYLDAVRPSGVHTVRPDRVAGWEPDPLWTRAALTALADEIDVLHVHFGFEHLEADALARWVDTAAALGLPVVLTVHDLRNPHLARNDRHEEHLGILIGAASEVLTLTDGAAKEIAWRWSRSATVVPHPSVWPEAAAPGQSTADGTRVVALPLGALRANVLEPDAVARAVVAGAHAATNPARVVVTVRPSVDDERLRGVQQLADAGDLELHRHDRLTDAELVRDLSNAHALVLPYRFGTHSGWVELARDAGTRAVVPSCGYYTEQSPTSVPYVNDEEHGLVAATLAEAVRTAVDGDRPPPADRGERRAEREQVKAAHEIVYRRVMAR